ncbi:MAG: N-acetyltransferase [Ilumatobacteraceae bacterium]
MKAVLDDLMERDVTVVPSCWYVAAFLDQHPEYERLRS